MGRVPELQVDLEPSHSVTENMEEKPVVSEHEARLPPWNFRTGFTLVLGLEKAHISFPTDRTLLNLKTFYLLLPYHRKVLR